jgi:hypothetical protein
MPHLTRRTTGTRNRAIVPVLVVLLALVAAVPIGVSLVTAHPNGAGDATPAPSGVQPAAMATMPVAGVDADPPEPAGPVLQQLAAQLTDASADTTSGRYSYVDARTWLTRSSGTDGGDLVLEIRRVQHWQASAHTTDPNGRPDGRILTDVRHIGAVETATGCRPIQVREDPDTVLAPPDVDTVRSQLAITERAGAPTPDDLLRNVTIIANQHALQRPVRAAMLQALAKQPGLRVRRHARDAAGRPGVDVFFDYVIVRDTPMRQTVTFSTSTGEVLASAFTITGPSTSAGPGVSAEDLALTRALLPYYRLYLDSRYTTADTVPQDSCPAADNHRPSATPTAAADTGPASDR